MSYSMTTMRHALKEIGISKGLNAFAWEKQPQAVNPHLASQFTHGRGQNFVNDVLEYCWLAYSKALNASGPELIGRDKGFHVVTAMEILGLLNFGERSLTSQNSGERLSSGSHDAKSVR